MSFFSRALAASAEDLGAVLATVVAASGSTPRHLGARMMIGSDGRLIGSVGGGRIEHEVMQRCEEVARTGEPQVVSHHLVRDLAMCCGGSMDVALTQATGCRPALLALATAERERVPLILETPVDGGPWRTRAPAPGERPRRRPHRVEAHIQEVCGLAPRVILFGAGHVGRAVGELAATCGFEVIACDDGDTGALDHPLPWAKLTLATFAPAEVELALAGFGEDDLVLIVTRDHAVDQRILEALLPRLELGFLGMIGSRGKVARFLRRMVAKGLVSGAEDPRWARLAAPIGLDLGAETPAEIAVSVVAQLVAIHRLGQPAARVRRAEQSSPPVSPPGSSLVSPLGPHAGE